MNLKAEARRKKNNRQKLHSNAAFAKGKANFRNEAVNQIPSSRGGMP